MDFLDLFNSIWAWVQTVTPADALKVVVIILSIVASLMTGATIVVKATPTLDDDSVLAKIYAFPVVGPFLQWFESKFSWIKRKD